MARGQTSNSIAFLTEPDNIEDLIKMAPLTIEFVPSPSIVNKLIHKAATIKKLSDLMK